MKFLTKTAQFVFMSSMCAFTACNSSQSASGNTETPRATPPSEPVFDAAPTPPLTGTPLKLSGPYATLEAYCAEFRERASTKFEEERDSWSKQGVSSFTPSCSVGLGDRRKDDSNPKSGFSLVLVRSSPMPGTRHQVFAVQSGGAWFVQAASERFVPWGQLDEIGPHRTHTTRWSSAKLLASTIQWNIEVHSHFQGHGAPSSSTSLVSATLTCALQKTPTCAVESTTKETSTALR